MEIRRTKREVSVGVKSQYALRETTYFLEVRIPFQKIEEEDEKFLLNKQYGELLGKYKENIQSIIELEDSIRKSGRVSEVGIVSSATQKDEKKFFMILRFLNQHKAEEFYAEARKKFFL